MPEEAERVSYEPKGFLSKFLELNKVMWRVNQGLSSTHTYASRPKVKSSTKKNLKIEVDFKITHIFM